jgi:phytoene desaturase
MSASTRVAVVGAGAGGLSAAVALAARGYDVTVFEAAANPGGKIGVETVDGTTFDTGPSLLTLPEVLERLLEPTPVSVDACFDWVHPEPAFRYRYPDGTVLETCADPERTIANVESTFGPEAAEEFEDFLAYTQSIWEAAAPHFIFDRAPSFGSFAELGLRAFGALRDIDPMHTMWEAITSRVSHPKLRDLFARFATYTGSSPFEAPATLNCIAWVELGLGARGVEGGMFEIARQLESIARQLGVTFHFETPVRSIETRRGRIETVETDDRRFECDAVVANAGVDHLEADLLSEGSPGPSRTLARSMSGWTALLRARRRPEEERPAHTALFASDYGTEFRDVFEHGRPPRDPTVYLCAQEKAHRRDGWEDHEPLFVMANAPAVESDELRDEAVWRSLRERVLERLRGADLVDSDDAIVWERTPLDLAERFPGSRGAIYGAASNSKWAAFRRPANRVDSLDGLYLASGSVHPGGGVPLCLQSGRLAADTLDEDVSGP